MTRCLGVIAAIPLSRYLPTGVVPFSNLPPPPPVAFQIAPAGGGIVRPYSPYRTTRTRIPYLTCGRPHLMATDTATSAIDQQTDVPCSIRLFRAIYIPANTCLTTLLPICTGRRAQTWRRGHCRLRAGIMGSVAGANPRSIRAVFGTAVLRRCS